MQIGTCGESCYCILKINHFYLQQLVILEPLLYVISSFRVAFMKVRKSFSVAALFTSFFLLNIFFLLGGTNESGIAPSE